MAVEGELAEVGPAKEQSNSGGEAKSCQSRIIFCVKGGQRISPREYPEAKMIPNTRWRNEGASLQDKTASSVLGHLSIGTRSGLLLGHPLVGMSFKGASNGPGRGELPAGGSAEESSGSES